VRTTGGDTPAVQAPTLPVPAGHVDVADGAQWTVDPAVQAQVEETLSCLTLKRRRFLKNFLASGHIARSVQQAGYNPANGHNATDIGREILRDPKVQFCTQAIFEAEGIGSAAKLKAVLGHHLAGYDSVDGGDRDRSLRAASLVYKHGRPRPQPGEKPLADRLLDEMDQQELETFIQEKRWPERFRDRLAPSLFAAMDVRHHHGRQPPAQSSEDPVNSHAACHAGEEPLAPMEPLDPADVAPPRSASPSAGASSTAHGDYIGAPAPTTVHGERVYDPTSTPSTEPSNAPLLESYATAQREIALGEARLREARDPVHPALRDLALRDRRW
jgi:hypothetical protein